MQLASQIMRVLLVPILVVATPLARADDLTELPLPGFQAGALAEDAPIKDLLLEPSGTAWMLGRTSIWRWDAPGKALKRLKLGDPKVAEADELTRLGSDGLNLFAAGGGALYQAQWSKGRVFRFALKPKALAFGFAGSGDDFWVVHSSSLFQFDRYGKALRPSGVRLGLKPTDLTLYDPPSKTLWIARQRQLLKWTQGEAAPTATLKASQPLLGLAKAGGELVLHTAHAVLRVGADGKLKGSIPVEGRRRLAATDVSAKSHAYLFGDHLLEIFDVDAKAQGSYRLPVDTAMSVSQMAVRGPYVAVLIDGTPRAFSRNLPQAP